MKRLISFLIALVAAFILSVGVAAAKPPTFKSYYWTSGSEELAFEKGCLTGVENELAGAASRQ